MRLPVRSLEQRRPGGTRDLLELVTAVYHGGEWPVVPVPLLVCGQQILSNPSPRCRRYRGGFVAWMTVKRSMPGLIVFMIARTAPNLITRRQPRRIIAFCPREAGPTEGAEYIEGFLGALIATQHVWAISCDRTGPRPEIGCTPYCSRTTRETD